MMNSRRMKINRLKNSIGFLIAFVLFFFLGRVLVLNWKVVGDDSWRFHLPWLIASFGANLLYSCLLVKPWLACLRRLGTDLSYRDGFRICYLSQLGRYLPGRIWGIFGQMYLCEKAGIRKTDALLSTVFQLGFLTCSGLLISLGVLPFTHPRDFSLMGNGRRWMLLFLNLCFMVPFILVRFGNKGFRFISRKILRADLSFAFSPLQCLYFLWIYLLLWGCCGLAFFLFVKSLFPLGWSQFPAMMGIYATAWTVGFLSVVTPGGLGVREGVLSLLLVGYLPPATATLVALLSRLWSLVADLVLAGCAFCWRWKTHKSQEDKEMRC